MVAAIGQDRDTPASQPTYLFSLLVLVLAVLVFAAPLALVGARVAPPKPLSRRDPPCRPRSRQRRANPLRITPAPALMTILRREGMTLQTGRKEKRGRHGVMLYTGGLPEAIEGVCRAWPGLAWPVKAKQDKAKQNQTKPNQTKPNQTKPKSQPDCEIERGKEHLYHTHTTITNTLRR